MTDINSFLPVYPSIHGNKEDDLYNLFPNGFYQSLHNKKEFHDLQPNPNKPREEDPSGNFVLQTHQVYATRYASTNTPYDDQLIVHSMGTGKTALAVSIVENNIGTGGIIGGVIIVRNKRFIKSFVIEIIKLTGQKYYPPKHAEMTKDELRKAIRKIINTVYKFITFEAFANRIENMKEEGGNLSGILSSEYSNRVFIVDEAHNLRIQPEKRETSKVNQAFHLFFHSVYNCKKVLMTGTPMKDRWGELADLANLILPLDNQLETGDKFEQRYLNDGRTIQDVDALKKKLFGLVSTLRTIPTDVKIKYIGQLVEELKVFTVDVSKMSPFQTEHYNRAYREDKEGKKGKQKGFYGDSRQAINFVFPDGSYGAEGFLKYMIPLKKREGKRIKGAPRIANEFEIESFTPELRSKLQAPTHQQLLENISKYSCKYAATIKDILNQRKNKSGSTYIYNIFVGGSGCIVFARLLEMFGYTRSVRGEEKTSAPRYVILTDKTVDKDGTIIANVQKTFASPENVTGDLIQVIIGSTTSGEGLSFSNVQNIGIHTPYFNYASVEQAIARGIRYKSHDMIRELFTSLRSEGVV